jgi:hypothetical protein
MVKRIKAHINSYCTFCKKKDGVEKIKASWKNYSASERACEQHKHLIEEERKEHPSEADYQTWMRL